MAKMPLESQIDKALRVLAAQTRPRVHIVRKPRRGGKKRGPALVWRSAKSMGELYEAAAAGGGRYVIKMVGAYRTGATRYDVSLTGSPHYDNAYLGQARSSDAAKRMAAAHANRRAAREAQWAAERAKGTTRGPWDAPCGKARRPARGGKLRAGRLAQWKARKIEEALRRHDERDLSELVLQGYVIYDPQTYEYSLSPAYAEAYRAALAGVERSQRTHRVSSRARADIMRGLGMVRTRSGGWE